MMKRFTDNERFLFRLIRDDSVLSHWAELPWKYEDCVRPFWYWKHGMSGIDPAIITEQQWEFLADLIDNPAHIAIAEMANNHETIFKYIDLLKKTVHVLRWKASLLALDPYLEIPPGDDVPPNPKLKYPQFKVLWELHVAGNRNYVEIAHRKIYSVVELLLHELRGEDAILLDREFKRIDQGRNRQIFGIALEAAVGAARVTGEFTILPYVEAIAFRLIEIGNYRGEKDPPPNERVLTYAEGDQENRRPPCGCRSCFHDRVRLLAQQVIWKLAIDALGPSLRPPRRTLASEHRDSQIKLRNFACRNI